MINPDFIYFKEVALNDNNEFTLDFSDEEFVQEVRFKNSMTLLKEKLKIAKFVLHFRILKAMVLNLKESLVKKKETL